jgi:cytosine/adenosine deaminase-related metal-dependent hydrolase
MAELIFRGGTIVTVDDDHRVVEGDLAVADGIIAQVGGRYTPAGDDYTIVDAAGAIVMPGLVQAHVHTCQTLARGRADDLELLDWLKTVVWPYEGALDAPALGASARLAMAELLLGGTTAILDMGTVHHTDEIFAAAEESGLRATIGKAMMDAPDPDIPAGLREDTGASLAECETLVKRWHGQAGGRLRYAYAPRFVLSCTDELLTEVGRRSREHGLGIHTHASENQGEIAAVHARYGARNIVALDRLGLLGPRTVIAHCVHLDDDEVALLASTGTHVAHCPSSNLKLASGIASIPELIARGVAMALGAYGAPCNYKLVGFLELRLAALLHKPRCGPRTLPAPAAVRLATRGGADALGLGDELGALTVGRKGDVIVVDPGGVHVVPSSNPYSTLAYAVRASDVRHVAVDGRLVVRDRELLTMDRARVVADARLHATRTLAKL